MKTSIASMTSVVVCCYNSASRISLVLRCLGRQLGLGDRQMEIVVVDNLCTDNTVALVHDLALSLPFPVRLIREERPGLTYARECGLAEARGEIIIYCDDDNLFGETYVATMLKNFDEPSVGAVSGYAKAGIEAGHVLPDWFDGVAAAYACHATRPVGGERVSLFGAGIAVRRRALESLSEAGFSAFLTGRKGSALSSGEDTEFTAALRLLGWKLCVEPLAEFTHLMEARRLHADYVARLGTGIGSAIPYLLPYVWAVNGKSPTLLRWSIYRWFRALFHAFLAVRWSIHSKFFGGIPARYQAAWERAVAWGLLRVGGDERWSAVLAQVEKLRLAGHGKAYALKNNVSS